MTVGVERLFYDEPPRDGQFCMKLHNLAEYEVHDKTKSDALRFGEICKVLNISNNTNLCSA